MVIGPNGAGKTTLLDVISGRVKPVHGRVIFGRSTDLTELSENQIAALGIGRKFQTPSVFVNLTVWDNLELSLRRPSKGVLATLLERDAADARDRIAATLATVGLGGQGRRARPARCRTARSSGWRSAWSSPRTPSCCWWTSRWRADRRGDRGTGELLLSIAAERSVLVIEHDMEFVRQIARTVTVLHQGTVLCEGPVEQVQRIRGCSRSISAASARGDDAACWPLSGSTPPTAARRSSGASTSRCRPGRSSASWAATASARRRCCKTIMGLLPARGGRVTLDGVGHHALVARPPGAGGHRLRAAGPRDLPAPHGGGEPPDGAARLRARHVHRRRARPLPGAQACSPARAACCRAASSSSWPSAARCSRGPSC